MTKKTLADIVVKNFSIVKLKKASVKVPKLKVTKKTAKQFFLSKVGSDKIPTSSIIDILIKTAINEIKKSNNAKKMAKPFFSQDKSYTTAKERNATIAGGYGTISKVYGVAPHTSYVDYGKLFNYLGKFRSQSPYENMAEHLGALNQQTGSGGFTLVDRETMETGARFARYFNPAGREFGINDGAVDLLSHVPLGGMDSREWELFKLWIQLDKVAYYLKRKTA